MSFPLCESNPPRSEPYLGHSPRATLLLCSRRKESAPPTLRGAPHSARRSINCKRNRPKAFLFALSLRGQPTHRFPGVFFLGHTTTPTHYENRHCRHAARSSDNTSITTRRPAATTVLKSGLARGATTLASVDRRGWQRPGRLRPLLRAHLRAHEDRLQDGLRRRRIDLRVVERSEIPGGVGARERPAWLRGLGCRRWAVGVRLFAGVQSA